jgi:BMFP domain-containing protein YqiC
MQRIEELEAQIKALEARLDQTESQ